MMGRYSFMNLLYLLKFRVSVSYSLKNREMFLLYAGYNLPS
jgi:hypothetical protein